MENINFRLEEYKYPINKMMLANFGIVEDNNNKFPVCKLGYATSHEFDKQPKKLIEKQRRYANLIAAAPQMIDMLIRARKKIEDISWEYIGWSDEKEGIIKEIDEVIIKALGK